MILWLLGFLLFFTHSVLAAECIETNSSMGINQLVDIQKACEILRDAKHQEGITLKQAIASINAKINIAQSQINQTLVQISGLEKEIEVLGGVLDKVNISILDLSKIYHARVRESFRRSRVDQNFQIFASSSFGDFFAKIKYLNTIKNKDQLILRELDTARKDYDQRRQSKVDKQKEIEALKKKLDGQKIALASQQKEKQNLLTQTASDEKKFQSLFNQARMQQIAIQRFVSSQGGASILKDQTKCDDWGCYYNQRDSLWGNMSLGDSKYSVAESGCLVSSVSMVASHFGKNIKPNEIAMNINAFDSFGFGNLLHSFSVNGIKVSISPYKNDKHNEVISKLDSELSSGKPTIVGLDVYPDGYPDDHFIVILKKDGDKYIMNDPFLENGYNKPLTDKYSTADINSLRLVSFN